MATRSPPAPHVGPCLLLLLLLSLLVVLLLLLLFSGLLLLLLMRNCEWHCSKQECVSWLCYIQVPS